MSVSFINNLYTVDNGKHYNLWSDKILNALCVKLSKKNKKVEQKDIKKFFNIFVSCKLNNPTFKSQNKNQLTGSKNVIDTDIDITQHINKIWKWNIINIIKERLECKDEEKIKKTDAKKRTSKIENYDAANKSGTKYSKHCSLLLCEGLSAKTYGVVGMNHIMSYIHNMSYDIADMGEKNEKTIKGRDWMGIYPLRGVPLNSRNATNEQILKNREIMDIINILNLEKNLDYSIKENYDKLTYGRVVILTDADVDGIHIKGLLLNIFHDMFKSLLSLSSFVVCMKTPILKIITKQHKDILFYNEYLAIKYIETYNNEIKNIKYYKGLGTSTNEDIKQSYAKFMEIIKYDDDTDVSMDTMFNKKKNYSDDRKCLIDNHKINVSDNNINSINKYVKSTNDKIVHIITERSTNISKFIKKDMVEFSIANCKRAIPNIMDGLKQSQRKILFGVFKKNLHYNDKTIKVAQLSGYISENTNYHHGEQNLCDTIIKMAHCFVGTNNIPLLYPDGQFGSRLAMGQDAASPRYIFTKLNKYTRILFNSDDDNILTKIIDDGDIVEPEFYVPIIPMILVNGCKGIATGFSTEVINFNIYEIIKYIQHWLINGKYDDSMTINPWYKDFTGTISSINNTKWETTGIYNFDGKNTIHIDEIPIGVSIEEFKKELEKLIDDKKITSYNNYSTENKPSFEIKIKNFNGDTLGLIPKIKSCLNISNMTLFDTDDNLKKFDNVYDIIHYYCNVRYAHYDKRKKYMINILENELTKIRNKYRFILHVIKDNDIVFKRTAEQIIKTLTNEKYDKIDNSFEYLLSINVKSFTKEMLEKLKKLSNDKKTELELLNTKHINTIWYDDLNELYTMLIKDDYFK